MPVLEELRIEGLGVIDEAVLELAPGLTVVTGETGAGKTMIVQGLALLFGGRADAGRVRPGAARASVEGRIVLPAEHPAVERAVEAGAQLDEEGALLLTRTVGSDGRSRAYVGGRGVPIGVLTELAETLLAVHGQSDQQRLLRPAQQRAALDRYAGEPVLRVRGAFAVCWHEWRDARATLTRLQDEVASRVQEAHLLRVSLAEVAAADPVRGEGERLGAEIERLANADDLRVAAATAHQLLTGDDDRPDDADAVRQVTLARRTLEPVAGHDPTLLAVLTRISEAGHLLADIAADLASYAASVDADPVRLAVAQDRLAVLTGLMRRRSAPDLDALLDWADSAGRRLRDLDTTEDSIATLIETEAGLHAQLVALAGQLSEARRVASEAFGAAVSRELVELAMPHAVVTAQITQQDDPVGLEVQGRRLRAGPDGIDDVELLLSPHPGAPARALQKGASGGELSRVMLAVEVVFAGSDPVPVMVFDEVDAGVGGRAAVEVGDRLARLARDHQVLVVTHLPQVAAYADRHLVVQKSRDGSVTSSGVLAVEGDARIQELSRMLEAAAAAKRSYRV
jgi:DNA repair protein RecN (Recombination protein N)